MPNSTALDDRLESLWDSSSCADFFQAEGCGRVSQPGGIGYVVTPKNARNETRTPSVSRASRILDRAWHNTTLEFGPRTLRFTVKRKDALLRKLNKNVFYAPTA